MYAIQDIESKSEIKNQGIVCVCVICMYACMYVLSVCMPGKTLSPRVTSRYKVLCVCVSHTYVCLNCVCVCHMNICMSYMCVCQERH